MRIISIILLLLTSACTTTKYKQVEKDSYLKYSGYVEGCVVGSINTILVVDQEIEFENINFPNVEAACMQLYMDKLDREKIKPPTEKHLKSDAI